MLNDETGLSPISERAAYFSHGLVPVGAIVGNDIDVAGLRKEFRDAGLFTAWQEETGNGDSQPCDVPMNVIRERLAAHRANEAKVKANNDKTQAALSAPAPAPAPVAARPTLAEAKARLAEKRRAEACTVVSRPAAPVAARPAPEPKAERVPGEGEFYCLACPKKHVIAAKDAWVHSPAWLENHFEGRPPAFDELAAVSLCGQAARHDRRLNWYPMLEVFGQIQRWVATQAAAAESKRQKLEARMERFAPKVARKPVVAPKPNARGETKLSLDEAGGWAALGEKLKLKK